jgi:hypothetical protein
MHEGDEGDHDDASHGNDATAPPGNQESAKKRSPEEIATMIVGLTPKQKKQLSKAAHIYGGSHIHADDLLQSAFHLAVEGQRRCPEDVAIVPFLCGVMKSVSSGERMKQKRRGIHHVIKTHGQEITAVDPPDPRADIEELIYAVKTCRHIMSLFERDPKAREILELLRQECDVDEIRARTGLSDVAYQSKRRKIRRVLAKVYPKGWRS